MPEMSIVMPVYNASRYLPDAIESILSQSFCNFEFIIIDDASQDESSEVIQSYRDSRIRFLENQKNIGVARTLDKAIAVAKGRYIVRMDADDISVPGRLKRQFSFMEEHPEIGISGGWVQLFGIGPRSLARVPVDPQEISAYMLFETPMWHVTAIMRREMLEKHGLRYDCSFSRSEDYDLWTRAIQCFPMANIPEVFVRVREHGSSATRANWDEVTAQTEIIQRRLLERSGLTPSSEEVTFHHRVGRGYRMDSRKEMVRAEAWLHRLCNANSESKRIADISFRRAVAMIWFRVCANSGPLGPWIFFKWRNSSLASGFPQPFISISRFVASIIWHQCRRIII